jgi:hypothetical protein
MPIHDRSPPTPDALYQENRMIPDWRTGKMCAGEYDARIHFPDPLQSLLQSGIHKITIALALAVFEKKIHSPSRAVTRRVCLAPKMGL